MEPIILYDAQIWDNNELIRNFIPVLRQADNKPGLYDTVNKQFYINQASGEFGYKTKRIKSYILRINGLGNLW